MPELLAPAPGFIGPETQAGAACDTMAPRRLRVAVAALAFVVGFYVFEHDAAAFAGGPAAAEMREDRIRDEYVDGVESGSGVRKLLLSVYGFAGLVALAACRDRPWNPRWAAVALLGALSLWACVSVLSSDEPSLTVRRLAASGLALVGSFGMARLLRPSELLSVCLISLSLFVGYSFLLDLASGGQPWRSGYRFAGTLHPNIQAAYCGVLCLAAFTHPVGVGQRWMTGSLLAFGFAMLLLTESRTAVAALGVGLVAAFMVRLNGQLRWAAVALMTSAIAIAVIVFASMSQGDRVQLREAVLLGRTEQASSLTGRVPLWEELATYVRNRPVSGYGFESFWTADRIYEVMKSQQWALQSAHNAYLEFTLQLGLVGLALGVPLVLVTFNLLQAAYARTRAPGYAFAYGLYAFALTNSLLESHFVKLKYPTVIATIALFGVLFFFPKSPTAPRQA